MENPRRPIEDYSDNSSAKFRLIKSKIDKEETKPSKVKPKDIYCYHCGVQIDDEIYYKCIYHKNTFCYACAKMRGRVKTKDFPQCIKAKSERRECIWLVTKL